MHIYIYIHHLVHSGAMRIKTAARGPPPLTPPPYSAATAQKQGYI